MYRYVLIFNLEEYVIFEVKYAEATISGIILYKQKDSLSSLTFLNTAVAYLCVSCLIDQNSTQRPKGPNNRMKDQMSLSDDLSSQTH